MRRYVYLLILFLSSQSCKKHLQTENAPAFISLPGAGKTKSFSATPGNLLPMTLPPDFVWGINGHNVNYSAYKLNVDMQLDLVKKLGTSYYRVNVNVDAGGTPLLLTWFNELLAKAEAKSIKILPVIYLTGLDSAKSEADAYSTGMSLGKGFSGLFGSKIDYYEMGNEQDNFLLLPDSHGHDQDGSLPSQYNSAKFKLLASYLKGMNTGIKTNDPMGKTIVDNGGWLHYGFFQLLKDNNVPFDILGLHWYSEMGLMKNSTLHPDIINILSGFGKPIWITEINRRYGSYNNNGSNSDFQESSDKTIAQAEWLEQYVRELDNTSQVKAFFVYELFDEPELPFDENMVGITSWTTAYTSPGLKPAFSSVQYLIEETQYGYEDYIYGFYQRYNKFIDVSGINYWSPIFKAGRNKAQLLNAMFYESHDVFVGEMYRDLLDQATPDAAEKANWINQMKNGLKREDLIAAFCNSPLFWSLSGSSNQGFVNRIYQKLLNRSPDSGYWLNSLNNGTTRSYMVSETLRSQEYLKKFVEEQYLDLLKRPADGAGEDSYVASMVAGYSQEMVINSLMLSDEYWKSCVIDGYTRRNN
jgi:hypothetical protein